ncbi:MAG: HD domain-containing protein [Bacteroidota bacterium]
MQTTYTDCLYGTVSLETPLHALIQTDVMQRLKHVHQGGAVFLVNPHMSQTRFDHSVGVMLLIRRLGGSMTEQVAGLLHDMAHTAFSHLIDYVLEIPDEDYHEKRHKIVLQDPELGKVLRSYGMEPSAFADLTRYPLLEYPKPGLSADRIDYTLRDQWYLKKITQEEIQWFLAGLQVFEGRIVLSDAERGKWFQRQYRSLVEDYFNGRENAGANTLMTRLVQEAMQAGALDEQDFWEDDDWVVGKLEAYLKTDVAAWLQSKLVSFHLKDAVPSKPRSIDPEVWVTDKLVRTSNL